MYNIISSTKLRQLSQESSLYFSIKRQARNPFAHPVQRVKIRELTPVKSHYFAAVLILQACNIDSVNDSMEPMEHHSQNRKHPVSVLTLQRG